MAANLTRRAGTALISVLAATSMSVTTAGCGSAAPPPGNDGPSPTSRAAAEPAPASPWDTATREKAARVVDGMSLPDKVGQLFVTYAFGPTADSPHPRNKEEFGVDTPAQIVERYHPGGLIHFSWTDSLDEPKQIAELSNGVQEAATRSGAKIPLLISTDQEQGAVTRIGEPVTPLPGNMALGAGRSPENAERAAAISGQELRAMGLNQNFAPSGDVNVNPANPVIGVRSFSADPQLAASLTRAQVKGYEESAPVDKTVVSAVKHFPGHGDTNEDSHTSLPVIEHTREQWEQLDAPPFREAIAQGVDSVMSAHIVVPKLDDSGEPATLAPKVLTGMLREELGFQGVITTDSLQMDGVREKHPDGEIPVLALEAGADQMLMPQNLRVAIDGVLDAVRTGRLTEERIDRSVERIIAMKSARGILDNPLVDVSKVDEIVGSREHRQAAQDITDHTTTVLRNDDDVLPLREAPGRVLVTGAGDDAPDALADRIRARGPETEVAATGDTPAPEQIGRAVEQAKDHDLTVVLTHGAWQDDNAGQRDLVRELQRAGVRVVAVPIRDPYDAGYVDEVPTWVATYSDKPVAMESLTKVLFGEIGPRGELPVRVPDPNNPETDRYPIGHGLTW